MTPRQELLLAYGIAEYDKALAHLRALEKVGTPVPYGVTGRIRTEQRLLVSQWLAAHGDPFITMETVERGRTEARRWLADHADDLDELLLEEEGQA